MDHSAAVARLYEHLDDGRVEEAYGDFDEACVLTSRAGSLRGRHAMIESDRQLFGLLTTHRRTLERILVDGDDVATWIRWSGTVAATGKSFECAICNVFHFEGGRIVRWESYGDLASAYAAFAP